VNDAGAIISNKAILTNDMGAVIENKGAGTVLQNFPNGTLTNAGFLINDSVISSVGIINVTKTGSIVGTGTMSQAGGTTTVDGTISQNIFRCIGGIIKGGGTISTNASGTFGLTVERDCQVSPFNSIGTLTLDGGSPGVAFDGELDIEIAGVGNYDILKVIGGIGFGSNSKIKFIFEGYAPKEALNYR